MIILGSESLLIFLISIILVRPAEPAGITFTSPASPYSTTVPENDEVTSTLSLTFTASKTGVSSFTWATTATDFELGSGCTGTSCDLDIKAGTTLDYETLGAMVYIVEVT